MKVIVNIPLHPSREYLQDFDKSTIPNAGDMFDHKYMVEEKRIDGDTCILDLKSMSMERSCYSCKKCVSKNNEKENCMAYEQFELSENQFKKYFTDESLNCPSYQKK